MGVWVGVCVCVGWGGGGVGWVRKFPFEPRSWGWANLPDNLQHLHLRNVIWNILGIK